jgi:hypothetical protein
MGAGHPIGGHSIELRCRLNRNYILMIILLEEDKRGYNLKNPRWRCSPWGPAYAIEEKIRFVGGLRVGYCRRAAVSAPSLPGSEIRSAL